MNWIGIFRVATVGAAAALVLALTVGRAAAAVPTEQEFTSFIASKLREAAPKVDVRVEGPLRLTVTVSPDDVHDLSLDRIYGACQHDPDGCAVEVHGFVRNMAAFYAIPPPPLDVKSLRITVRRADFVQALRENLRDGTGPAARHVAGDYWAVIVADQPTTIRMMSVGDLAKLGLTPDQAFARAKRSMGLKMRRALVAAVGNDTKAVSVLNGDSYQSALFAFPDIWAAAAAAHGGKLMIAVPGTHVVICADASRSDTAEVLSRLAKVAMAGDDHPLSDAVFRWSPDGWTEVSPPGEAR